MAGKDRYAYLFIEDRLRLFRGAAASVPLLGLDLKTGYIVGTTAMAGDLVASFVKSHLGLLASHGNGARSDSRIAPSSARPPGCTLFEPNRHHLRRPDLFWQGCTLSPAVQFATSHIRSQARRRW